MTTPEPLQEQLRVFESRIAEKKLKIEALNAELQEDIKTYGRLKKLKSKEEKASLKRSDELRDILGNNEEK